MAYEDNTINSSNPLARLAHRARYKLSLKMLEGISNINLLDFGCGDGTFLNNAHKLNNTSKYIGYEPYMESNMANDKSVNISSDWSDINQFIDENGKFDFVTCFEVLEHFSEERQEQAFKKISQILKDDGTFIISVPIEKGLPVIPKNLRRIAISYKGNENIYTFKNIFFSLVGIKSTSLNSIRIGDDYLSHMGFYFNDLEVLIKKYFKIVSTNHSPFSFLPYFFNSQIFYELKLLDNKNSIKE